MFQKKEKPDSCSVKVDDKAPLIIRRDECGGDVKTGEKWENVLRRLARNLGGLVPQLEEGVDVVVDGEDHPEPVAFHQLGQRRRLPFVVGETLEEAVLVDLSYEEGWSKGHRPEEGREVLVGPPLMHQAPESAGQCREMYCCEIVQLQLNNSPGHSSRWSGSPWVSQGWWVAGVEPSLCPSGRSILSHTSCCSFHRLLGRGGGRCRRLGGSQGGGEAHGRPARHHPGGCNNRTVIIEQLSRGHLDHC